MKITRVGVDIAKQVFQIHGVGENGKTRLRKQLARAKMLEFFAQLPPCLVGIEACSSAHYWGRELTRDRCARNRRTSQPPRGTGERSLWRGVPRSLRFFSWWSRFSSIRLGLRQSGI